MKETKYTPEQLLSVLDSYLRLIERNGKDYPLVTLDDISHSITAVLKVNNYERK